ncbi:SLAM family member 5-like protein [Labeo rohita]|uniref:SLAM family member 5-like protein n=1 Tax=Labeo rohita TaxID=84645 RepID=A0A498MUF1_LABRO|nr:SLAM family member 5-like protein [Labeo rohita]
MNIFKESCCSILGVLLVFLLQAESTVTDACLSSKRLDMNNFQESCCSILGVLLFFLLQGRITDVQIVYSDSWLQLKNILSCADPDMEVVHKAVGDSLELTADYPKDDLEVMWKYNGTEFAEYQNNNFKTDKPDVFHERLRMNKDNISVTVTDLKIRDSGSFSIIALEKSGRQHPTKTIELHVHDRITDVQIEHNDSWSQFNNICPFHLQCLASGNPNPFYSWSGHQVKTQVQHLKISLHPADSATLTCTANNTISVQYTTKTVVCTEISEGQTFCVKT